MPTQGVHKSRQQIILLKGKLKMYILSYWLKKLYIVEEDGVSHDRRWV